MNEAIKPSTWHLPRDKHGPSQPHWARKSARRVGRAHRTPLAWRDCSASEAALEGNAFALHATCLHQIARAHRLSCAAGRGTQRQPNSARARGRGEGELPWACGWRGGAKGMRSGVLGGQEGRIPPPPPPGATTADGAKGGSQGAGARRQACGQAGPSVGLAFPPRQRALASSIELLPAPKLSSAQTEKRSSDHRRRGAEVGRERPGPSQIIDSFARQRSATPALFGSIARHGLAPALGRASAPQPNLPPNLPTLYGLLGHHKTP